MKITINQYYFENELIDYYSIKAIQALYDYLIAYEEDTQEEITFNTVIICQTWTEYSSIQEVIKNCDNLNIKNINDLKDYTEVIEFEGGLLVAVF